MKKRDIFATRGPRLSNKLADVLKTWFPSLIWLVFVILAFSFSRWAQNENLESDDRMVEALERIGATLDKFEPHRCECGNPDNR